jgi:hypothetical protein
MKLLQDQGLCEIIKNADPRAKGIAGQLARFYPRHREIQTEIQGPEPYPLHRLCVIQGRRAGTSQPAPPSTRNRRQSCTPGPDGITRRAKGPQALTAWHWERLPGQPIGGL